jgi:uncharacterized protein YgiM (DUF1202 family)
MKRIGFYQIAIILSVLFSVNALAEEGKRPAAFGPAPEETTPVAAPVAPTAAPAVAESNAASAAVQFPYVGEVTAADLNIRSGAGTNFYSCGKVGSPARVIVVGENNSWSQILPPPGSFSWIFKQYVQVDTNKPDIGIVNSDNVRVYAGAEDRDATLSDSVQVTLNKSQKVRIVGQAVGDYFKIAPPDGATLWMSTQYVKFLRKADGIDMAKPKEAIAVKPTEIASKPSAKPSVMVDQVDPNSRYLEQYYVFTKQLDEEKAKPIADQNFAGIRAGLEALAADKNAGKAAEYAQYTLKTVSRYELAKESMNMVESQKSNLQKQLEAIEQERQKKKAEYGGGKTFDLMGVFKPSAVYRDRPDIKRYLVMDEKNMPVSYAEPAGEMVGMDLKQYYGKKVGLNGVISTDSMSNFALIKFTEIDLVQEEPESAEPQKVEEESTQAEPAAQEVSDQQQVEDVNQLPVATTEPNQPQE